MSTILKFVSLAVGLSLALVVAPADAEPSSPSEASLRRVAEEVAQVIRGRNLARWRELTAHPEQVFDNEGRLIEPVQEAFYGPRPATTRTRPFEEILSQGRVRIALWADADYAWAIYIPEVYWAEYERNSQLFLERFFMQKYAVCDFEFGEQWRISSSFCFSETENPFENQGLR